MASQQYKKEDINQISLDEHAKGPGKLAVASLMKINNHRDLSIAYAPGVAEPCRKIAQAENATKETYKYTMKGRTIAVVSDGSAVLGLGNIGGLASLPVMEGKAVLYKQLGNIDAFPVIVDTQDVEKVIETVKLITPSFGGINLEDIAAPHCFRIERELKKVTDIPIFHDDQHGTAIVVVAALRNAAKCVNKQLSELKVLINGAGAGGNAVARMLMNVVKEIVVLDSKGVLHPERSEPMDEYKKALARETNPRGIKGSLSEAIKQMDVFVGVSKPGVLKKEDIQNMAPNAIVFALANPDPEIPYDDACDAGAAVIATGRSDFPNQINNAIAFPGVMKGALRAWASDITENMKHAASEAIAEAVKNPSKESIIPDIFQSGLHDRVANAVEEAARTDGVARC